jgi:serine phosphatase RsbU (regulator of sigma subunit)
VSRSGVVIADVADKGVPAALFMALCRTLVRTMAMDGRSPSEVIRRANDLILADSQAGLFVTLVYAILNSDSGEIEFVNAGHLPVLLMRADDGVTEELRTNGMAVGVLPGIEFEQRTTHLDVGDLLVLYTDGVIEAQDAGQEMFGKRRLIETVRDKRAQSPEKVAQAIDDAVAAFVGDIPQFDDFTLVVAKRSAR